MTNFDVSLMNENLSFVAAAVAEAGISIQSIAQGMENCDAGIFINDMVCVSVGPESAHVTFQIGDEFDACEDRAIGNTKALIDDIRAAVNSVA